MKKKLQKLLVSLALLILTANANAQVLSIYQADKISGMLSSAKIQMFLGNIDEVRSFVSVTTTNESKLDEFLLNYSKLNDETVQLCQLRVHVTKHGLKNYDIKILSKSCEE